jgi:hypothetical protein
MLLPKGSGTSGSPIVIKFESGAILQAPYWSGSAININGKSYITIDGGGTGIIQNTANGTTRTYQQSNTRGVDAGSCTGCTVKSLTISDLYVRTSSTDLAATQQSINCVSFQYATNLTVNNVTCHDAGWAFAGAGDNFTLENSNIYNIDHGVGFGAVGTVSGFSIHDNHIHDYASWDSAANSCGASPCYHHDGIHMWGQSANSNGLVTNGVIYNNLFDGDVGTSNTAHIFLQDAIQNVVIFNNVLLVPTTRTLVCIELQLSTGHTGLLASGNAVYNNFISAGGHAAGGPLLVRTQTNFTALNNVQIGGNGDIGVIEGGSLSSSGINNQLYDDLKTDFGYLAIFKWQGDPATYDLATWQGECQCDGKSLLVPQAQINADSSGHLLPGSKGIGLGANLTGIATGMLAPLAKDRNGVTRPSTGAWDVGAYESQGGTVINFGSGFSSTGMAFNGSAALSGTHLRVTNGGQLQAGSGWYTTLVNVQKFTTDFTFQLINPNADGMTFAIQNSSIGAIGACGGGLGYGTDTCSSQPGIPSSVAVKFDLFSNHTEGNNSTGIYTNGAAPTIPATTLGNGVNLHSGDVFKVHMTYDGTTLTMTITDTVTNATFTTSWAINIPSTVGANTAYVGFTGATGGQTATQDIISWTYNN